MCIRDRLYEAQLASILARPRGAKMIVLKEVRKVKQNKHDSAENQQAAVRKAILLFRTVG